MSDCKFTSQVESLGFYFFIIDKSLRQYINHIPYAIMQAIFCVCNCGCEQRLELKRNTVEFKAVKLSIIIGVK